MLAEKLLVKTAIKVMSPSILQNRKHHSQLHNTYRQERYFVQNNSKEIVTTLADKSL